MIRDCVRYTNQFILLGVVLELAGRLLWPGTAYGETACFVGSISFIIGCYYYAKGKCRSGYWCLLGLLSIVGLVILVCLKDRSREC